MAYKRLGHAGRDGKGQSPTYTTWRAMIQRTTNPNNIGYKNYGGRGIVCDPRWLHFEEFLTDMGERPDGLTLDRVDNAGPYCKSNCRWATWSEQMKNRRKRNAPVV